MLEDWYDSIYRDVYVVASSCEIGPCFPLLMLRGDHCVSTEDYQRYVRWTQEIGPQPCVRVRVHEAYRLQQPVARSNCKPDRR